VTLASDAKQFSRARAALSLCFVLSAVNCLSAPAALFKSKIEPLLESHCFDCHGDGEDKGGLTLDDYRTDDTFLRDTKTWLAVWRMLDSELMPPPRKSQLAAPERKAIQDWIVQNVFAFDPKQPDPGRVTIRRLNRVEYANTVRDWLGISYDTDENFPPDDTGHGFDNNGDVLSLSPLLMEKYLDAAQAITAEWLKKIRPKIPSLVIAGDRFQESSNSTRNARSLAFATPAVVTHTRHVENAGRYRITVEFRVTGSEEATTETARLILLVSTNTLQEQSLGWDNRKSIKLSTETELARGQQSLSLQLAPGSPPLEGENHLAINVRNVRIEGPLDGVKLEYPSDARRFFPDISPPDDDAAREIYAKKIIRSLAERAFRRPVEEETLKRLVALAMSADTQEGVSFEQAIGQSLTALLASPRFLFRVEQQQSPVKNKRAAHVDEFSLASRLSYFLWSSMPDDELFTLAHTNGLRVNLPGQIKRMLSDKRAERFVENFVGQWLQTRDVDSVSPDPKRILGLKNYSEPGAFFSDELRRAMRQETELLFTEILRNNGTLGELLTTRTTFLNGTLARHYDVPGVTGEEMRKVELPADSPRAGLLTHGSILLVTSNPTRTSPVKRGLFVLENLLGTPSPPPPPDVPELEAADQESGKPLAMRELMVKHRENPMCATCHERMDPIGLAFEHFNALGGYRQWDNGQTIDTSGVLVTGEKFTDAAELLHVLTTSRRHDLYRCVTEKLLTYALGRGIEYHDIPTIQDIVTKLERDNGRLQTLIHEVINSPAFQMRAVEPVRHASSGNDQPIR
jgi:hypothetical protein